MTQEVEKEAIVCVTAVHFYGTQKTEMSFCGKTEKEARVDRVPHLKHQICILQECRMMLY